MIGASHGGFLTLEYLLAHPEHLYGAIMGDCGAQWSHWACMSAMKTALTDPRVRPDPEQVLRLLSGRTESMEDLSSGVASIFPLYSVPDELKGQAEVNVTRRWKVLSCQFMRQSMQRREIVSLASTCAINFPRLIRRRLLFSFTQAGMIGSRRCS